MRKDYLPYYRPHIEPDDIEAVADCLRRGWLTTGPKVRELEESLAAISGVRHAVAVNSCTAALQLGLIALGVGADDEVIMPSLSFVAGAECVTSLGGKPVFCDVDETSLCITPATIQPLIGPHTKVIIPMHYGGQPGRIKDIVALANPLGIAVLEDAAHGAGTVDGGGWPGSYSDAAAYSFYATKNVTSAEGGALLTNRDDVADKARVLSLHGMDRDAWKRYMKGGTWVYDVIEVGYKYNLSDMAAALGISQLKKLEANQTRRDTLARVYLEKLAHLRGLKPVAEFSPKPDRHSWCIFAITVDEQVTGITRDDLINELRARNIGTSVHFIPTHMFSAYRHSKKGDLSTTERVSQRMLSLPLYPDMSEGDVGDVVGALKAVVTGSRLGFQGAAAAGGF